MHRFVSGPMADAWVQPFEQQLASKEPSAYRCIEIDYISDRLYAVAGVALEWSARTQVGAARLDRVAFVYGRAATDARAALGLSNRLLPYVFLVNAHGRVCWRAVGLPTEKELERVMKLARKLASDDDMPADAEGAFVSAPQAEVATEGTDATQGVKN